MADTAVAEFEAHRARMFGIAYRMLGSASEAEDIVQEAYLRWERTDRDAVAAPGAWLAKVVTNLSLNELSSARARRERYVGQWLPEPVLTSSTGRDGSPAPLGPLETAEQRESVSLALLVLLERLTPPERAVFVLREAFAYTHRGIAEALDVSEANSRQLYRRARQAVHGPQDAEDARDAGDIGDARDARDGHGARGARAARDWSGLVLSFVAAAREGDLARLERLLAEDVVSYADGGGKVNTARRPILGSLKVARYLIGGLARYAAGVGLVPCEINGGPALVAVDEGGQLFGVVALDIAWEGSDAGRGTADAPGRTAKGAKGEAEGVTEGRIVALRIAVNPDKLDYAARQLAARPALAPPRPARLSHPEPPSGL